MRPLVARHNQFSSTNSVNTAGILCGTNLISCTYLNVHGVVIHLNDLSDVQTEDIDCHRSRFISRALKHLCDDGLIERIGDNKCHRIVARERNKHYIVSEYHGHSQCALDSTTIYSARVSCDGNSLAVGLYGRVNGLCFCG